MSMAKPDLEGLAIGDTLLKNYQEPKFCIFYRSGEVSTRLDASSKIGGSLLPRSPTDIIVAEYANQGSQALFSGTRTPTGSTEFGTYQPVRNGQDWRLPLKRVKVVFNNRNNTGDSQRAFDLAQMERAKVESSYGSFCGINKIDVTSWSGIEKINLVLDGNVIEYTIYADESERDFAEHGSADIINKRKSIGEEADAAFTIGETYAIGSAQGVCIETSSNAPYDGSADKSYRFKITSRGNVLALGAGRIKHFGTFRTVYGADTTDLTISKLAIGSVTTTRAVDQIEIGIKSIVYKRFNGIVNFAGVPDDEVASQIENGGGTVNYGLYSDYGFRYSFFYLEYRKSSSTTWELSLIHI